MLQDFPCPITVGGLYLERRREACDWTGEERQSEELRQRERSQEEREPEWRLTWCYQKVRIIGLKLYHLALKLLYWHLVFLLLHKSDWIIKL